MSNNIKDRFGNVGPYPTSSDTKSSKSEGSAIGYGYLVEAKRALFDLQDQMNEMQRIEVELTKDSYKSMGAFGKCLGDATLAALQDQAEGMRENGVATMISGGVQVAAGAVQGGMHLKTNNEMKPLQAKEAKLTDLKLKLQTEKCPRANTVGDAAADPEATAREDAVKARREEFQRGQFTKVYESENEEQLNKDAIRQIPVEEREAVIKKVDKELARNSQYQGAINSKRSMWSSHSQTVSTMSQSCLQGAGQYEQAAKTQAQATQEAIKSEAQTSLQMMNPADTSKRADDFNQNAMGVLQTIQAIDAANKSQGG